MFENHQLELCNNWAEAAKLKIARSPCFSIRYDFGFLYGVNFQINIKHICFFLSNNLFSQRHSLNVNSTYITTRYNIRR